MRDLAISFDDDKLRLIIKYIYLFLNQKYLRILNFKLLYFGDERKRGGRR